MSALRIEIRCILYSDIVGSTPQSVQARQAGDEGAFSRQVGRFLEIAMGAAQEAGATFGKPLGDGLLATFADPLTALQAVLTARSRIESDPSCRNLPVRTGLHVGTVGTQPDGDVVGADAALGERVQREAKPGQILVSEAFATQVKPYLPADLSLADIGERELKGFERPVRLFEVLLPRQSGGDGGMTAGISSGKIRILLVDDESLLRRSLAQLLELDPDLDLVGEAANGALAVVEAKKVRPDVVLTDIQMPHTDGVEATRQIKAALPGTEVVILTKFGDDDNVFNALKAGAIGYLLKDAGLEEIRAAVKAAARGEGYLSPPLVARVLREFGRLTHSVQESRALFTTLSRREVDVLELLGQGLRNRAIAEKLFLSEKTVKNHITNILVKLEVNDRTEAALLAQKHGWAKQ